MLVDAAKHGDVEIPYFCYEPKLGAPVGACRMCLVEIEGIPKLQTVVLDADQGRHGRPHDHRPRQARPERGRRVPARQPPARLPRLRQGRRVPAAGHLLRLGRRQVADDRAEAPLQEAARGLAAGRDRPRALHPLLPLRALLAGDRRGLPARLPRARRPHLCRHPRRPPLRRAVQRQHHRAVPGRGADLDRLPLPRAAVGRRGGRLGLHRLRRPVQRLLHRPRRRQGAARARARQRGGRRRLGLRQGPLRLRVVPLARARDRAAGPRRRRAARGVVGARARRGREGARARRRAHGGAGRRRGDQRGGAAAPAPAARRPRLAAPRLRHDRRLRPRPSTRARAARAERPGVGPRLRGGDPRRRGRAGRRGAGARPARAQGAPPQRRAGDHADQPPEHARRSGLRSGRRSTGDLAVRFAPGAAEAALAALAAALGSPRAGVATRYAQPAATPRGRRAGRRVRVPAPSAEHLTRDVAALRRRPARGDRGCGRGAARGALRYW